MSTSGLTGPTSVTVTTSSTTSEPSTSDASNGTSGESSGSSESSTTGPMLPGTCAGFDTIGALGEVLALDGATIETTCEATPAGCGGDIVGTWTIESSCGWEDTPNLFADMCPTATQTVTSGQITGTRTFNADMTFAFDLETMLELELNIDAMTCYGVDCATFEMALEMQGFVAACTDAGDDTCDCMATVTVPSMTTGTWVTADNTVVVTNDDGEGAFEYCVNAERLDLWTPLVQPTFYEEMCEDEMDCADALGNLSEFYACIIP